MDAISKWEDTCSGLEARQTALEDELTHNGEIIANRDWTIEQLKAKNEKQQTEVEELRMAAEVKPEIEDDLVEATCEISRLTELLESERQLRIEDREELQAELSQERGRHKEARDEIEALTSSLEEIKSESEEVVNQWSVRCEELENAFNEVSRQLEESSRVVAEQEEEANEAISSWEKKVMELETELDQVKEKLEDNTEFDADVDLPAAVENLVARMKEMELVVQAKTAKADELEGTIATTQQSLVKIENDAACLSDKYKQLEESQDELKAEVKSWIQVAETAKDNALKAEKQIESVKAERDHLKQELSSKSREAFESERSRLTVVIAQLEEELREANDMIQACITDESADKATEIAAQGLREEIQELQAQLADNKQRYEDERAAREVAELEVDRLRDDIAALVSLSDQENTPTALKKLTSQAIEKLQKKERAEIDEMRKSLFRSLEELEAVRSAEKEANEKLSKVRLQISMYEQELLGTKSEIQFLSQALDEMRETEESKRASLEYRIGSLENENDVVRKYHAAELENVRNELSQITMEKDRLLHALQESEKTNASLVFAASKGGEAKKAEGTGDLDTLEAECNKLRVENQHLLEMAADDKARAERRLRELLAAQSASSEADVILEHELRLSAEAAVQTLKLELQTLQNERAAERQQSQSDQKQTSNEIGQELESLKLSLDNYKRENQSLKTKLKEEASKAQVKIDALTDECRAAQAKAHKLHQEGRFEALVHSEKTRLSNMTSPPAGQSLSGNRELMLISNNFPANDVLEPSLLSSSEAFDMIRKQKEEIQEERKMYREFLQEHDSLLALLAQLDVEKSCLREALVTAAGEEAFEEALRKAEETAEQMSFQ